MNFPLQRFDPFGDRLRDDGAFQQRQRDHQTISASFPKQQSLYAPQRAVGIRTDVPGPADRGADLSPGLKRPTAAQPASRRDRSARGCVRVLPLPRRPALSGLEGASRIEATRTYSPEKARLSWDCALTGRTLDTSANRRRTLWRASAFVTARSQLDITRMANHASCGPSAFAASFSCISIDSLRYLSSHNLMLVHSLRTGDHAGSAFWVMQREHQRPILGTIRLPAMLAFWPP